MINKNLLKGKNVSYKKINYANFYNGLNSDVDEYILPINRSIRTYNFNFANGALVTGLGLKPLNLPITKTTDVSRNIVPPENVEILASWVFRYTPNYTTFREDYLVVLTKTGKLMVSQIYTTGSLFTEIGNVTFTDIPTILNYKLNGNYGLLISSKSGFYSFFPEVSDKFVKVENAPNINSICLHNERAFATVGGNREEVWFSKELDPTNWNATLSEGGFISFVDDRGQCNKVLSFLDRVYVFRDYGINRITPYANQTEFDVSELYVSSGQIHANTVCECGDRIIMLTDNGLYCFDGTSTTKLNVYINEFLSKSRNNNAIATYYKGKYYLACYVNFGDFKEVGSEEYKLDIHANNVLIELDVNTNMVNILRGVEITSLSVLSDDVVSKLVVCSKVKGVSKISELTYSGAVFDEPTKKVWLSPMSNFGYPEKKKFIKDIFITSKYPITVTIRTELYSKKIKATPINNLIHLTPKISGKQIAIDFETDLADCYISSPTIVVGVA